MSFPCIGFFDSGQGGLTLWEQVLKTFPKLNTIYVGDNGRYPYGNKGTQIIQQYSRQAVNFLTSQGAKYIVVACGTASSSAVPELKQQGNVPVTGIIDALSTECVRAAGKAPIAILGTRYTVGSKVFENALLNAGAQEVWARACPLFVPLVEEGLVEGPLVEEALELYLKEMPNAIGAVALACTHFPRLAPAIRKYLDRTQKSHAVLVDAAAGICREIGEFLNSLPFEQKKRLCEDRHHVYCSDDPRRFAETAQVFTGMNLRGLVTQVDLSEYEQT